VTGLNEKTRHDRAMRAGHFGREPYSLSESRVPSRSRAPAKVAKVRTAARFNGASHDASKRFGAPSGRRPNSGNWKL
jgi:hypothetical protein